MGFCPKPQDFIAWIFQKKKTNISLEQRFKINFELLRLNY